MVITTWLKLILDSLYDGVLIADRRGKVVYINPSYTRITKISEEKILGKRLLDVRPGSHLTEVINSGNKELGIHRKVGDVEYIVNMVPIYADKRIIGGISILNEVSDIVKLNEKLKTSCDIIKKLEENVQCLGTGTYFFKDIITEDIKSIKLKEFAKKISKGESNILITGESGTGKELYASSIHNNSERKNYPFVVVNCASFDKNLIESELFGYVGGAFTGGKRNGAKGLFEIADKGTIFLDEIGELEYELQGKLLRVLQEKTIRKVGGLEEIPVDVRVICATNQNLEKMIEEKKFRKDLYYRINIIPLNLLSLKERKEDIIPLTEKFLKYLNDKYKKNIRLDMRVKEIFYNYHWKGNVRELRNMVEFLFNIVDGDLITDEIIPDKLYKKYMENEENYRLKPLKKFVEEKEREYIQRVLKISGDNMQGKKKAAEMLGISLASLYNKL